MPYHKSVKRDVDLALSNLATIYACCGLFDMCGDEDLLSLSMQGADKFLDWLGWQPSDVCIIHKDFIQWMRPDDNCSPGYVGDPCADPNGVEWGTCDFELTDFGRVRREGPVRDITENSERLCERQPRYRLDGSPITDDREFDMRVLAEVVLQDIRRLTVTGNAGTAGQWDGLQQLVANGYTNTDGRICAMMDSYVVNWNGNGMGGGNGITWNGNAIANTFDFVDVLKDVVRYIRQRISWSPTLASQQMQVGDMILVMPTFLTECLLDFYTCWSVCPGTTAAGIVQALQTFEARTFRNNLLGGMFGDGQITLDNITIPLLGYNWGLVNGPTTGDIYLLVGSIGTIKTMQYQHLNMNSVSQSGYVDADQFAPTDGGRFLHWNNTDHTCIQQIMEIRPRMLSWAPWTNARFQDVVCGTPLGPLSPDPCDTSFFPETSFSVAECP